MNTMENEEIDLTRNWSGFTNCIPNELDNPGDHSELLPQVRFVYLS